MSKNSQGYMGPQIGKLGPAIGYLWKGRQVFRGYNPFVKDRNSEKQQLVRTRFKAVNSLMNSIGAAVNLGFGHLADTQRTLTRNLFLKANWDCVHADTPGAATVDYTELQLASGSLANVFFGNASFAEPLSVEVPITDPNDQNTICGRNDKVILLVYSPEATAAVLKEGHRDDESLTATVPASWNGHRVHVWGFTLSTEEEPWYNEDCACNIYPRMASNSLYLGSGTIS